VKSIFILTSNNYFCQSAAYNVLKNRNIEISATTLLSFRVFYFVIAVVT